MGRLGTSSNKPLDFTDGDTLKRFTITDSAVEAGSFLSLTVHRAVTADVDDPGWIYVANVLQVRSGSFDVLVAAFSGDGLAGVNEFPNETAMLTYLID